MLIDDTEVRRSLSLFRLGNEEQLFEVRIIKGNKKNPTVGYFTDVDLMLKQLHRQDIKNANIYTVLNVIKPECYSRMAHDVFIPNSNGTQNSDIAGRTWILVDIDPQRSTGISSTDEQVALSKSKAKEIYEFLKQQGFNDPVIAFSGNGYHLLYHVKMINTDEYNEKVKRFLYTLDNLFSDGSTNVDISNFNASRVCKLYGTLAQKGSNTKERPHRMSRIEYVPKKIEPISVTYIDKVNNILPEEPDKPQRYNNYNGNSFDLESWMQKYGLNYRTVGLTDGNKYILDHCPFDASHTGKDAVIFQRKNGAIGFHCFHNSCQGKTWKDVRILFEPDAYEKKWQQLDKRMYGHFNRNRPEPPKPLEEKQGNPIWLTPMDVFNKPREDTHYIKTGYTDIDKKMYGLKKKGISVLTGLRSAGKSTWLDGLILNAIQDGNVVGCYSGELDDTDFMTWLVRQAAGKEGLEPGRYEGQWNVPRERQKVISEWLEGKFFLYNNNYGNNFIQIHDELAKKIDKDKLDLVVLDNLMALDIEGLSDRQWDAQKKFVQSVKELAVQKDVHVMFVAHPRKVISFLRLEDISGSGDLSNAVDDAFLIHRNNEDFKLRSKEMFKWNPEHVAYTGTNVIEIAKDRWTGVQDWFIPLWYEPETKRLKNSQAEHIIYGWNKDSKMEDGFMPMSELEDPVFD